MKKLMTGKVQSAKMTNTASVVVTRTTTHPLYGKKIKSDKPFLADNTIGAKEGDTVIMESTRPISKNKHFKIITIKK